MYHICHIPKKTFLSCLFIVDGSMISWFRSNEVMNSLWILPLSRQLPTYATFGQTSVALGQETEENTLFTDLQAIMYCHSTKRSVKLSRPVYYQQGCRRSRRTGTFTSASLSTPFPATGRPREHRFTSPRTRRRGSRPSSRGKRRKTSTPPRSRRSPARRATRPRPAPSSP